MVEAIKGAHPDLPVYTHTCGAIGDRLDLMEETGTDGVDTLDPPPLGTVELAAARAQLGQRLFIKGNIDPVATLLGGSAGSCLGASLERLTAAKAGGGYILSSACSVAPHTPPENIRQLARAADAEGWYGPDAEPLEPEARSQKHQKQEEGPPVQLNRPFFWLLTIASRPFWLLASSERQSSVF